VVGLLPVILLSRAIARARPTPPQPAALDADTAQSIRT